ncbi:MAG: cysteine peptidase family C39 domain-containing protein [Arachidicoccus sp.]|nr:cysteine peptidase family C39 domain-containing protein [Arachidicoccus sp.]
MRVNAFPYYKQLNAMDCGPTCLRMVAKHYGRHYNADTLRQKAGFSKQGVTLLGISETAEKIGFRTRGVKIDYFQLSDITLPCILHWDQNHFVVLIDISKKKDYAAFAAKYPINGELKQQGSKIKAMSDWCYKTEIAFTPTFFVNSYQLPEQYSVADLKYFFSV